MKIKVRVIPGAKENKLVHQTDGSLRAYVTAPPIEGAANKVLIKMLAKKYKVTKSEVEIIKGLTSRDKLVRIDSTK
jgi:uncharacterized protein